METDDIKSGVFVIVCMTVAGVFGYFTGMHRVEVQRTVYVDTNIWTHYWHVDASNEVPVRFTNDDPGYVLTSSNTWVPIPIVYPEK